jgi:hypothetical protein
MAKRRVESQNGNLIPTIKSWELPQFPCVQVMCNILLKNSWRGLQLCFKSHLNPSFANKVMGPQRCMNPRIKWHLEATSWPSTKYIIRGKVVASLKFGSWWVLWVRICPWFVLTPKVFQLYTNQLMVWVMQVCVNKWIVC